LTSTKPTTPPKPDELEISLFGPGFGECIVAHAGFGDWMIVDSCLSPHDRTPAGLKYLRELGVDVATSVKRIIATHWHNDHVKGLSQTVAECKAAKFICSQSLWSKEFIALTDLWRRQRLGISPVTELTAVLDTISKSQTILKGGAGESPLGFAIANRCLWRRGIVGNAKIDTSAELHSLSPSDAAVQQSLQTIAKLLAPEELLTHPLPSRPNQFSVVLWLRAGSIRVLLGADLEEQHNAAGGWAVIVGSVERPQEQSSLFKIPHHGSVTGECEAVWKTMLTEYPVALLTPFHSGRTELPTRQDVDRICGRTPVAFIACRFRGSSSRGRTGSVNRTIHETVRYIRPANDGFGHVRARRKLSQEAGQWSVATFGDAIPLTQLYGGQRHEHL